MDYYQEEYPKHWDSYAELTTILIEREIKGEINAETRKVLQAKIEGKIEGKIKGKVDAQMEFVRSLLFNTEYTEEEIASLVEAPLQMVLEIRDELFS